MQTSLPRKSQLPPAAVVLVLAALFDNHGKGGDGVDVAGITGPTSSSNPSKKSSSITISKLSSSVSLSSAFSVVGDWLAGGDTGGDEVCLLVLVVLSSSPEVVGLFLVLPAKELRCVGTGWLCSPV